jgi:jumonji domain-containing protein 2
MERTFWKSLTINPPIYGADTPCSLFDEKISNGWSLRNLDDLLSAKNMPEIQGVTSPMTYFGMWKVRLIAV